MRDRLRFVLVLHQHQPVGNLDSVVEQVYQDSYRPLLDMLAEWPAVRVNLHVSGSLFDWLEARHPEYLDRLGELVHSGQVEMLGGAYYDPILAMLPERDRRAQLTSYRDALTQRFGRSPLGAWIAERIWEPALAADLATCGIEHTVLDDVHFQRAGLRDEQLDGYYLTEYEGQVVGLFAGRERLRYLIPFAPCSETIDYLRAVASRRRDAIVVYADDAEKFGAWPGMQERVFEKSWLREFFATLTNHRDWLDVTTLGACVDEVPPLGKVYLPEGSYREMHEWSSLTDARSACAAEGYTSPAHGTWRNFRVKYPEIDEMYSRMLMVSERLASVARDEANGEVIDDARRELHRAQCGCAYWHGVFGGVFLPQLRQAVYRHLIAADVALDLAVERTAPWLSAAVGDFNFDVQPELLLANEELTLLLAPHLGGQIYECDVRAACCNLLATMGDSRDLDDVSDARIRRKSLIDHFYDPLVTLDAIVSQSIVERGDFADGCYQGKLRRVRNGVSAELTRRGAVNGHPVTIAKRVTLSASESVVDVDYFLEGLPAGERVEFAVEFNFATMSDAPEYRDASGRAISHERAQLDLAACDSLRLANLGLNLGAELAVSRAARFWAFPVRTSSQGQSGEESIVQSIAVLPHWTVTPDADGRWSVAMRLAIGTESGLAAVIASRHAGERGTRLLVDGPHKSLGPKTIGSQARMRS